MKYQMNLYYDTLKKHRYRPQKNPHIFFKANAKLTLRYRLRLGHINATIHTDH